VARSRIFELLGFVSSALAWNFVLSEIVLRPAYQAKPTRFVTRYIVSLNHACPP